MIQTVVVFAKAPRAGAVKSRLAAEIGVGRAAAIFRILLMQTLSEASGPWRTLLAIDPPSAVSDWGHLGGRRIDLVRQGGGDLGMRMRRVFDQQMSKAAGPVVIIGADAAQLRRRHLRAAFDRLRGADAVFGPALDGGYWLIGLAGRRAAPSLFDGVRWSSAHALNDTIASLPSGFSISSLEALSDIDEVADLDFLGPRATAR